MAVLDFPASPALGDKYPTPAVAGQPQYTWDGEKWTTVGAQVTTAAPASALPLMDAATALVGTATKYAREDHVHPKIPAAPMDALAYSGMQINGSMEVSQELGSAGIGGLTGSIVKSIVDGWKMQANGPQVATAKQAAGFAGQSNCFSMWWPATANPSPVSGNYAVFRHDIEGYRISRLAWGTASAQPITIGFWISAFRPGLYSGSVANGGFNRSYPFTFTVSSSFVWEYKAVTIPGDIAGTWASDNTIGMIISIAALAFGSIAGPAGTWAATGYFGATGAVNGAATTSDSIAITGVVVLPGIEAPSAARSPLIMRPFDQELLTCQRYFREMMINGPMLCGSATSVSFNSHYNMRAPPAIITKNYLGIYANGADRVQSDFSCFYPITPSTTTALISCANFTGLLAGGAALRSGTLPSGGGPLVISWLDARL